MHSMLRSLDARSVPGCCRNRAKRGHSCPRIDFLGVRLQVPRIFAPSGLAVAAGFERWTMTCPTSLPECRIYEP